MSRAPQSRRLRRGGLLVLAASMLASVVGVPHASTTWAQATGFVATGSTTGLRAAETEQAAAPVLVVASDSAVIDREAENFGFTVLLRNEHNAPLSGGVVTLSMSADALVTPFGAGTAESGATESGAAEAGVMEPPLELAVQEVPPTAANAEEIIEFSVPREEMPGVLSRADGVYELQAQFVPNQSSEQDESSEPNEPSELDAGLPITASTPLVWGGFDAVARVPLTLVVPLVVPATIEGVPDVEELAALAPSLLQLLSDAERHNATLAVDPRIVTAVRSLGTSAPADGRLLVERLERTLSPVFMLQFADADPAVQAALGFDELLQPLGFDYLTRLGTFSAETDVPQPGEGMQPEGVESEAAPGDPRQELTSEPESDSDGTDTDGANGVPTLEELTTLTNARPGAWPAEGQVDSATLSLLTSSGLGSLVLSSTNVSTASGTRATLGEFDALIADADLASAGAAAIGASTSTERNAGLSNLAAQLAVASAQATPGLVLALDRGAVADQLGATPLSDFFAALDSFDWAQVVAERLQPEGAAVLRAAAGDESRRELLRATMHRSQQIDELSALLEEPEHLTQFQRSRLLETFATRYAQSAAEFDVADRLTKQRDEQLLQGVQPITTDSTQLVGASSHVPITLNNALPFDAVVSVHAVPLSAAISLAERDFDGEVPALGNAAVLVPVHSRVSSGESGLLLEVRDAASEQTFATGMQRLTLRTTIESTILWVLGSAAGVLLVLGVWRSIKRRRGVTVDDNDSSGSRARQ